MIHLHVHSSGSTLDGAIKIDELVDKVVAQGESAVAITDHGNMVKGYEFYKECTKKNIKPIMGCEFYMGEKEDKNKYHIVLLAKNNTGLKNLYKLVNKSYDLFYRKPRISLSTLERHREGLICLSGCIGSEIAKLFFAEKTEEAMRFARHLKTLFGDDFYLEIQPHSIGSQKRYNTFLEEIHWGNIVVTSDAHFLNKEDFEAHDTLLCMQTISKKDDEKRWRFPTTDTYIMEDREVYSKLEYLKTETIKTAIDNTHIIASKCNVTIEYENLMPDLPGIEDPRGALAKLIIKGLNKRTEQGRYKAEDRKEIVKRLQYELNIIDEKGFSGYFLILEDFYRFCKENDIPTGIGRGSAAGSEVAYVLGLTEVSAIKYGLLFERFLNPTRNGAVDFDADICYENRHLLIEYIKGKYGEANTAHIMAEGTLQPKAVIEGVMKSYGYTKPVIDEAKSLVEKGCTIKDVIPKLTVPPYVAFDLERLGGLMKNASKHAAGVLIMNDRVDNHVPVRWDMEEKVPVCEWHKKHVEALGCYKFDLLGLKQLTIFDKTLKAISRNRGVNITLEELYNIDVEDKGIYETLNKGALTSIFQMAGDAAGHTLRQVEPNCFEDIMVITSICRPGVKEANAYLSNRKLYNTNGAYPVPGYWELIKDILEPTYGALVYQEQTMQIMNRISGWSLGKADGMRKVKNLDDYREDFITNAVNNVGVPSNIADNVYSRFDLGYTFNKSHACSYSKISAICAWLLHYYPVEFLSATLTIDLTNATPSTDVLLMECRQLGIQIAPADINISTNEFYADGDLIRIPLTCISHVGDKAYEDILAKRPFTSFNQFVSVVEKKKVNKRCVIHLIKSGAFDSFDKNRSELLEYFYKLKGDDTNVYFYCDDVRMQYEKETYGFYLSKHPLDGYSNRNVSDISEIGSIVVIIAEVVVRKDKNGGEMAFITCENKVCKFRPVVFSRDYMKFKKILTEGARVELLISVNDRGVSIKNANRC